MKIASIFETKTNLSKYITGLIEKKDPYIVIVKNGKPVARLIPYENETDKRIGSGRKKIPMLKSLKTFNEIDTEIAGDFMRNGGLL